MSLIPRYEFDTKKYVQYHDMSLISKYESRHRYQMNSSLQASVNVVYSTSAVQMAIFTFNTPNLSYLQRS